VRIIRSGPPRLSVMGLPGVDERANAVEFFVHHEDVRRGAPGWQPRELSGGESDMLWHRLRMARFLLRKAPVGVELARDDTVLAGDNTGLAGDSTGSDRASAEGPAYRITAKNATPAVTVVGSPAELTMWVMGRTGAARVRFDGTEAAVGQLTGTKWR